MKTENICGNCGHEKREHIVEGLYEPDMNCSIKNCPCKKFVAQNQARQTKPLIKYPRTLDFKNEIKSCWATKETGRARAIIEFCSETGGNLQFVLDLKNVKNLIDDLNKVLKNIS